MNKLTLSIFIALAALTPSFVFAADVCDYRCEQRKLLGLPPDSVVTTPPSTQQKAHKEAVTPKPTTPAAPADGTTPPAAGEAAAPAAGAGDQFKNLDNADKVIGCGNSGKPGAMAGNSSQSTSQFLKGLLGNKFLDKLPGPLRNMADKILDKALSGLTGANGPLSFLNNLDPKVAGALTSLMNGDFGGAAQSLLSGVFGSGTQTAQQAAAAIGKAVPVPGGAAGFGALVPVDPKPIIENQKHIDAQTLAIQKLKEISNDVTCNANPATKDQAQAANNKWVADAEKNYLSGNHGKPFFPENWTGHFGSMSEAATKYGIEAYSVGLSSKEKGDIKRITLAHFKYLNDPIAQTKYAPQNANSTSGNADYTRWKESAYIPTSGAMGELINFVEAVGTHAAGAIEVEKIRVGAENGLDKQNCTKGSAIPKGSYCDGNSGKIVLEYKFAAHAALEASVSALKELQQADEIHELPSSAAASLQSVLFEGLNGLKGLLENSGSKGSFLDQMTGENGNEAQAGVQAAVGSDIESALVLEDEYRTTTLGVLTRLTDMRTVYSQVAACYTQKGDATKSAAASTTITTLLTPEITRLTTIVAESDDAIDVLLILLSQIESALTPDDIADVHNQFVELTDSGLLHNQTDLDLLKTDISASAEEFDLLALDAVTQLAACKAL